MGTALLIAAGAGAIWAVVMAVAGSRAMGRDLSVAGRAGRARRAGRGRSAREGCQPRSAGSPRPSTSATARSRRLPRRWAPRRSPAPRSRWRPAWSPPPAGHRRPDLAAGRAPRGRGQPAAARASTATIRLPRPDPLSDLHRWAASAEPPEAGEAPRSRHAIGPWGAFVVVDVSAGDELARCCWRCGRAGPCRPRPELDLFGLIGQQAATAIDHALLYATVRSQADELNRHGRHPDRLPAWRHARPADPADQHSRRSRPSCVRRPTWTRRRAQTSRRSRTRPSGCAAWSASCSSHRAWRWARVTPCPGGPSRVEPIVRRTWEALRADRPFELCDEGPAHLVVADPDRLEQVLWAVLDNAVKYSQPGSACACAWSRRRRTPAPSCAPDRDRGRGQRAWTRPRESTPSSSSTAPPMRADSPRMAAAWACTRRAA